MPRRRMLLALAILVPVSAAAVYAGGLAIFALTPATPGKTEAVAVEVRKGNGPLEVSTALASRGVITDARKLVLLGRALRQWKRMKAGEYAVSAGMTPLEVLSVVTSGVSIQHPVTIREGMNVYEIAAVLAEKGFAKKERVLALARDPAFIRSTGLQEPLPPTLEGYLFPDTYFVNRSMDAEEILRSMVRRFQAAWKGDWDAKARALGLSRREAVTLASIVEKETGAPAERPLISSVFHNRLRKRMRLQSDPTIIYGIWERYDGNLRRSDLLTPTPYNTYTVAALPAGPIGNPGLESLAAALQPAPSEFLYFVSRNDGTHEFTRTLEEHLAAVRRFQLDPSARAGKSWRDLNRGAGPAAKR